MVRAGPDCHMTDDVYDRLLARYVWMLVGWLVTYRPSNMLVGKVRFGRRPVIGGVSRDVTS